jgi:hypothetical protein
MSTLRFEYHKIEDITCARPEGIWWGEVTVILIFNWAADRRGEWLNAPSPPPELYPAANRRYCLFSKRLGGP